MEVVDSVLDERAVVTTWAVYWCMWAGPWL